MIQLERVTLPEGLRALAYRDERGNLIVYVSKSLDARVQRAAVMEAIRATRRTGWRAALPPVGVALVLAARVLMRGAVSTVRVRPAAWGAAAGATVLSASAAAVFVTAVPHHGPAGPSQQPGPPPTGQSSPHGRQPAARTGSDPVQPVAATGGSPGGGHASTRKAGKTTTSSAPGSAASPAPASPAPALSPLATPSPTPTCIINLLGIKVCTPAL